MFALPNPETEAVNVLDYKRAWLTYQRTVRRLENRLRDLEWEADVLKPGLAAYERFSAQEPIPIDTPPEELVKRVKREEQAQIRRAVRRAQRQEARRAKES